MDARAFPLGQTSTPNLATCGDLRLIRLRDKMSWLPNERFRWSVRPKKAENHRHFKVLVFSIDAALVATSVYTGNLLTTGMDLDDDVQVSMLHTWCKLLQAEVAQTSRNVWDLLEVCACACA